MLEGITSLESNAGASNEHSYIIQIGVCGGGRGGVDWHKTDSCLKTSRGRQWETAGLILCLRWAACANTCMNVWNKSRLAAILFLCRAKFYFVLMQESCQVGDDVIRTCKICGGCEIQRPKIHSFNQRCPTAHTISNPIGVRSAFFLNRTQ